MSIARDGTVGNYEEFIIFIYMRERKKKKSQIHKLATTSGHFLVVFVQSKRGMEVQRLAMLAPINTSHGNVWKMSLLMDLMCSSSRQFNTGTIKRE